MSTVHTMVEQGIMSAAERDVWTNYRGGFQAADAVQCSKCCQIRADLAGVKQNKNDTRDEVNEKGRRTYACNKDLRKHLRDTEHEKWPLPWPSIEAAARNVEQEAVIEECHDGLDGANIKHPFVVGGKRLRKQARPTDTETKERVGTMVAVSFLELDDSTKQEVFTWAPAKIVGFEEAMADDGKPYMKVNIRWWGNNRGNLNERLHPGWKSASKNSSYYYGKSKPRGTPEKWVESIWGDQVLVWGLTLMEGKLTTEGHDRIAESLDESQKLREHNDSDSQVDEMECSEDED